MPFVKRLVEPVNIGVYSHSNVANSSSYDSGCGSLKSSNGLCKNDLDRVTVLSLIDIMRQLSSVSFKVQDMFEELHEETAAIFERTRVLTAKVVVLKEEVSLLNAIVEEVSLHDLNLRKPFKSNWNKEQQIISKSSRPACITQVYNLCEPPPALHKLNPCRNDGRDSMKFFTDPGYFFRLWSIAIQKESKTQLKKHKKHRKASSNYIINQENQGNIINKELNKNTKGDIAKSETHKTSNNKTINTKTNGGVRSVSNKVSDMRNTTSQASKSSLKNTSSTVENVARKATSNAVNKNELKNPKSTTATSKETIPQDKNSSNKQEATKPANPSKELKTSNKQTVSTITKTKVSNATTFTNKAPLNSAIYSNTSTSGDSNVFDNKANMFHDALDLSKKDVSIKSYNQISIDNNNNINENLYENTSDLNQAKTASSQSKETTEVNNSNDNTYENAQHILQKHPQGNDATLQSTHNEYVNHADDDVNRYSQNSISDFIEPETFDKDRKNNGIETFIQNKVAISNNNENLTNENHLVQENNNKDASFELKMNAFQFNAENIEKVVSSLSYVEDDFSNLPPVPPPPISPSLTMESSFPSPPPSEHLTLSSKQDAGDDDSCRDINEIIKSDLVEEDLGKGDESIECSDLNDEEVKDTRCDLLSAIREGIQLRKVEERKERRPTHQGSLDVQSIMEEAFEMRRRLLEEDEEEDESGGGWSDDE